MGSRLLTAELIARKTDDGQIVMGFVKRLQASVLWRCSTSTGHVHHQPTSAAECSKSGLFAVHVRKGDVEWVAHDLFLMSINYQGVVHCKRGKSSSSAGQWLGYAHSHGDHRRQHNHRTLY